MISVLLAGLVILEVIGLKPDYLLFLTALTPPLTIGLWLLRSCHTPALLVEIPCITQPTTVNDSSLTKRIT